MLSFLSLYVFPDGHLDGDKLVFQGAMADMVRDEQFVAAISDYLFDDDVVHFYEYLERFFPEMMDSVHFSPLLTRMLHDRQTIDYRKHSPERSTAMRCIFMQDYTIKGYLYLKNKREGMRYTFDEMRRIYACEKWLEAFIRNYKFIRKSRRDSRYVVLGMLSSYRRRDEERRTMGKPDQSVFRGVFTSWWWMFSYPSHARRRGYGFRDDANIERFSWLLGCHEIDNLALSRFLQHTGDYYAGLIDDIFEAGYGNWFEDMTIEGKSILAALGRSGVASCWNLFREQKLFETAIWKWRWQE